MKFQISEDINDEDIMIYSLNTLHLFIINNIKIKI